MSKNVKGVLGSQFGKVGPVVARKFREENVYSAYQPNVKNPRTEPQQLQRLRFKTMSTLAHNFACGAIFGFRTAAKGSNLSPRNLFQKTNWPYVTARDFDMISVDYTSIMVSKGGLSNVIPGAPSFDTPERVVVNFSDNAAACQRTKNDKVYMYVYCPDANRGILSAGASTSESSLSVQVPKDWNGLMVHVYMFTRNEGAAVEELGIAAGECSPSDYLGSGNIG